MQGGLDHSLMFLLQRLILPVIQIVIDTLFSVQLLLTVLHRLLMTGYLSLQAFNLRQQFPVLQLIPVDFQIRLLLLPCPDDLLLLILCQLQCFQLLLALLCQSCTGNTDICQIGTLVRLFLI